MKFLGQDNMGKIMKKIILAAVITISVAASSTNVAASDVPPANQTMDNTKSNAGVPSNVPVKAPVYKRGTYHVALDGTGDFASIAQAVVLVPSGSTLIIHEGVYNEALNIIGKVINMKGTSKEKCVIQYDTANYANVPMNIAGGAFENLTINGYHKSNDLAAFQGYAIHIDSDLLANQSVTFTNCNIISENAFCVGIGLRRGARISFRACNFVSKKQGTILFHDSQTPALAGKAYLSLEGCTINNTAPGLVITQCISPASVTEVTFRNNVVVGNGDGYCLAYGSYAGDGSGWMGSHNVVLNAKSAGNNVKSFNYADMKSMNAMLTAQSAQSIAQAQQSEATAPRMNSDNTPYIKPGGKFYTIVTEDGREVNVPAEWIDEPHDY